MNKLFINKTLQIKTVLIYRNKEVLITKRITVKSYFTVLAGIHVKV